MSDFARAIVLAEAERAAAEWGERLDTQGFHHAFPELQRVAGPIEALQDAARIGRGATYLGRELDPVTLKPVGDVVLAAERSSQVLAVPGGGKTSEFAASYAAWGLASGDTVVGVTPHDKTAAAWFTPAHALTGGEVQLLDFHRRLISPSSHWYRTWDPTLSCNTLNDSHRMAQLWFGPKTPFREELARGDSGTYWGQVSEKIGMLAFHVVNRGRSLVREVTHGDGLQPNRPNGLAAVFDYLDDRPPVLPTELTDASRAALRKARVSPDVIEKRMRTAARIARSVDASVARLAYDATFYNLDPRIDVDKGFLKELQSLDRMFSSYKSGAAGGKRRESPLEQLANATKYAVNPQELAVCSPERDQQELTPEGIVSKEGGMTIIHYDTSSPGLAPAVFSQRLMDAQRDRAQERRYAHRINPSVPEARRLRLVLDEGRVHARMPGLASAITDDRQNEIVIQSLGVTRKIFEVGLGDEAATVDDSIPATFWRTPNQKEAEELEKAFGGHYVKREAKLRPDAGVGSSRTYTWEWVPKIRAERLRKLPDGVWIMEDRAPDRTDPDNRDPDHNPTVVKLVQVGEALFEPEPGAVPPPASGPGNPEAPLTPVGDAADHALRIGVPRIPAAELNPELADKYGVADDPDALPPASDPVALALLDPSPPSARQRSASEEPNLPASTRHPTRRGCRGPAPCSAGEERRTHGSRRHRARTDG